MKRFFDYSHTYDPIAPLIVVTLSSPYEKNPHNETIIAFLDTGADGTLIPRDVLRAIRARPRGSKILRGVTGERKAVNLYLVTIEIGEHLIQGIDAVAVPVGSEAIIGRDVLNQLVITPNGPGETVDVHPE